MAIKNTTRNLRYVRGHVSAGGPAGRSLDLPPAPDPEQFSPQMENDQFMPSPFVTGLSGLLGGVGAGLAQQPQLLHQVIRQLEMRQRMEYEAGARNTEALNAAEFQNQQARSEAAQKGYEGEVTEAVEQYKEGLASDERQRVANQEEAAYQRNKRDLEAARRQAISDGNDELAKNLDNELALIGARRDANIAEYKARPTTDKLDQLTVPEADYWGTMEETREVVGGVGMRISFIEEGQPVDFVDPDTKRQYTFMGPNDLWHWMELQKNTLDDQYGSQYDAMRAKAWIPTLDTWADRINQTDRPWRGGGARVSEPTGGTPGKPGPVPLKDVHSRVRETEGVQTSEGLDPQARAGARLQNVKAEATAGAVTAEVRGLRNLQQRASEELDVLSNYIVGMRDGEQYNPDTLGGKLAADNARRYLRKTIKKTFAGKGSGHTFDLPKMSVPKDATLEELVALMEERYTMAQDQVAKAQSREEELYTKYGLKGTEVGEDFTGR
jgi:hypothetical protein